MITVNGLVAIDTLGLAFRAGAAGGDRLVTWAHACDLPDPWRWVAAGNLVMTTGAGIPEDPVAQADWLNRLAEVNVSALVVAARADAPQISDKMLAAADARKFPVLVASFELEFVKLARRVIESALQSQRDRLEASQRLFQSYTSALRDGTSFESRLATLGRREEWHMEIQDLASGRPIASSGPPPAGGGRPETADIPGRGRAVLTVRHRKEHTIIDPLLVHYLAGLVGVELEQQAIERDNRRAEGETLLRDFLNGAVDFAAARAVLERRGLHGSLVSLAIAPSGPAAWGPQEIHHAPELRSISPLLLQGDIMIAVMPDREDLILTMMSSLGTESKAGVSRPIVGADFLESVHQARLSLAQARESQVRLVRYGTGETSSALAPKTLAEARGLVDRYLGPLIEYDRDHDTSLLRTLATFLANDGGWKVTASKLSIHRQTLVYRLRMIEQLTGLKPASTSGTAAFWLALQAGYAAGILPSDGKAPHTVV
ncbi:PucR family transcriptional regulator [Methylobacterium nodulans]|uniref:Transcriptional regulator, PucR family n=1 Tax=Methylobacterium nodulans (strain LMG 21967 / CNCM I-2342 / ORS 2060) TaxID=460265 RepID=B8IGM8_METNO|nr:PucR family transcriptional regulator [Methylobacterium nodulans]ACL55928.1 transcriptional regulator, PucR family [Methylobacterium nodulans ORS 2060]